MISIDCTTCAFTDGTCVENGGCNGCPAQYRAKTIDLNRKLEAATTSHGRAWIAFIGAVFVSTVLVFAVVAGAGQQHQINLTNQESGVPFHG